MFYSLENYKKNLQIALIAHNKQKTPTGLPYSYHILSVAEEIKFALMHSNFTQAEGDIAISCALLHDVKEDTKYDLDSAELAGNKKLIIFGVNALTKNPKFEKKEAMLDSIKRLKELPSFIQMVKLADRITNLDKPPLKWSKEKKEIYLEEAKLILKELGKSNRYLEQKLSDKITNYKMYIDLI